MVKIGKVLLKFFRKPNLKLNHTGYTLQNSRQISNRYIFIGRKTFKVLILLLFQSASLLYGQQAPPLMHNDSPKYVEPNLVTFEKDVSIKVMSVEDYIMSSVSGVAVDSNENLYLLDKIQSKIFVFDSQGSFIREMGEKGQGPKELSSPSRLFIHRNNIFIYESRKGYKIWDLDGNYIGYKFLKASYNVPVFKNVGGTNIGSYNTYRYDVANPGNTEMTFFISKFDKEFILEKIIHSFKILSKEKLWYSPTQFVASDASNNIYFLENPEEYIINKYDVNGNKLVSFGRKYDTPKFSKKVVDWFNNSVYGNLAKQGRQSALQKYPPVIRHMAMDNNDYLWVIVGEWYQDIRNSFKLDSTIDIFNSSGEFLYTLKSDKFSQYSFIKNGKLYSPPINLSQKDPTLDVYSIHDDFASKN